MNHSYLHQHMKGSHYPDPVNETPLYMTIYVGEGGSRQDHQQMTHREGN